MKRERNMDSVTPIGKPRRAYRFSLFVSGATSKSVRAIANIKAICDKHLPGQYQIEVVDIYQQPERLSQDQVVALPTLVKQHPLPVRRFIGDLSNTERVLDGLNLQK
jgi:circadian clock protein KaiB